MDLTTAAALLLNSSGLDLAANVILAPTVSPSTTTHITSLSHRLALYKATMGHKLQNRDFSPVTLAPEWSSMARLLILSGLSVLGSIGNVFMISSVMIEDHLKKAGE